MVENGTLGEMDVPPAVKKLIWSRGYNPKTQPCIFVPKLTTIRGVERSQPKEERMFPTQCIKIYFSLAPNTHVSPSLIEQGATREVLLREQKPTMPLSRLFLLYERYVSFNIDFARSRPLLAPTGALYLPVKMATFISSEISSKRLTSE